MAHTYNCGTASAAPGVQTGGIGLSNLAPGDTIRTGDFDVIVTEVQGGGNGTWTGLGYTEIPYLKGERIAVELKGVRINDCYEFTGESGTIQSAYDPNWGRVASVDTAINIFVGLKDLLTVYTSRYKSKLQEYAQQLDKVKASYQNDEDIPAETKQILVQNTALIQQRMGELISCDSSSNAPNGRKAAPICLSPEDIVALISKGLPTPEVKKQTKKLEFGAFQWETNSQDISNRVHTQANRAEIGQLIANTGVIAYWNEYQRYDEPFTRFIYENGLIHDALLGVRDVLSANSEDRIINNFYTGRQSEVAFELGDPVSNKLVDYYKDSFSHPYVADFINRIVPRIKEGKFSELTGSFVFDNRQSTDGIGLPNFSNISEIPFYDFYGIMGGTQKIKVDLELKIITQKAIDLLDPNFKSYEYTLQKLNATFHVIDWYGADEADINGTSLPKSLSESLKSFFMLQHFWGVGHPFQTRISAKLINEFSIK